MPIACFTQVNAALAVSEFSDTDFAQLGRVTMANESTKVGDVMEQARTMLALNPVVGPQMEQFWKAQDGILKETEAFSKAWFKRRHEAATTALETVQTTNGNGPDPTAAMRAMVDWQQGSFQRLVDDMQEWVDLCSRCAGRMTQAESEAGKEGAEKAAKRAKSAAKTQDSTPV